MSVSWELSLRAGLLQGQAEPEEGMLPVPIFVLTAGIVAFKVI